jgi:mono/diheme cytochrome c family protein
MASVATRNCGRPASLLFCHAVLLALLIGTIEASTGYCATPTAEQRSSVRAAETALKRAGTLYRAKKFGEAAEAIKDAEAALSELPTEPPRELAAMVAPVNKQLARARELLKAEGIDLPAASGSATKKGKAPGISFTRQVAPLLVAKCGACHVERSRGDFSMASYAALAKGSKNGPVIVAGDPQSSRMIELVAAGEMPRGGGAKVTPDELAQLSAWIREGAKFDGADSAAPLTSYAARQTKKEEPEPTTPVVAASGREEVLFARDIGATLLSTCIECHGERNPRGGLSMNTFKGLLRGGESGPVVVAGKSEESLLVQKLRGTAGERMPLDRSPLPTEVIDKIAKWIDLGAKFDGPDPGGSLEEAVALATARGSSHETLSRSRAELAAKNWRLILPDVAANQETTSDVLLVGSVSLEVLADVGRVAEEQGTKLRKAFKSAANEPLIKGRLTLYVFDKRFDYGEVGTMLEAREIPAAWRGHWRFTGADAYGCVLLSGERVQPGVVVQVMAGAYVASLGKIPRWFAEGTARALAARLDSKDPRVKLWDDQIARILGATDKPEGFLTASLPAEDNDILSYSFVKFLMSSSARYNALIAALQQGASFEQAFSKNFGAAPTQVVSQWLPKAVRRR